MDEGKTFTVEEAHQHFAKSLNGKVWELLQKTDRTKTEDELMIYAAHASCFHWLIVGTDLHHQRAEWLISHVFAELGMADPALNHASRCLELVNEHKQLMKDFDWAYAYEAVARAYALAGNREEARKNIQINTGSPLRRQAADSGFAAAGTQLVYEKFAIIQKAWFTRRCA